MSAPSIAIVGGGVAGLAAAWELERRSRAGELSVDLFEASDRLGGPIATDRASGLILEGGPDSFLTLRPDAVEFCAELGLSKALLPVRPSAQGAYIYRDGHLHRIPALFGPRPSAAVRTLLTSGLLHRAGRARVILGVGVTLLRPLPVDESVAVGPALRARFGREATEWLIEPVVSGVHPAPIDVLSLGAIARVLPRRWTAPLRPSASRAAPPAPSPGPKVEKPPAPSPFASLREGMGQLAETAQAQLRGAHLHLRKPVSRVVHDGDRYEVRFEGGGTMLADAVVLAVPAPVAARVLSPGAPEASRELAEIRMTESVVVGMVFDRAEVPTRMDGAGVLVPRPSQLPISAITWLSSKWDRPDPTGRSVALRVFLRPTPDVPWGAPDPVWRERALEGLAPTMGIRVEPGYSIVFRHPPTLAWYDVGHTARVARIRGSLTSWNRLEIVGSAYDGIGIPDAVRSGRQAAQRIARSFGVSSSDRPVGPEISGS